MEPAFYELRARCDKKYITALEAIAKREGVNMAEALRLVVRDRAKELNVWPTDYEPKRCPQRKPTGATV